jgi:hypothetical protein
MKYLIAIVATTLALITGASADCGLCTLTANTISSNPVSTKAFAGTGVTFNGPAVKSAEKTGRVIAVELPRG